MDRYPLVTEIALLTLQDLDECIFVTKESNGGATFSTTGIYDLLYPENPSAYLDELRLPSFHVQSVRSAALGEDLAERWHHDGNHPSSKIANFPYILLWSSVAPTEVRVLETGEEFALQASMLTLIDNRKCTHRVPQLTEEQALIRFFYRGLFPDTVTEEDLPDIISRLKDLTNGYTTADLSQRASVSEHDEAARLLGEFVT